MRRYLIILIAILVGLIVLVLIDKLANNKDPKKGLRNARFGGKRCLSGLGIWLLLARARSRRPVQFLCACQSD